MHDAPLVVAVDGPAAAGKGTLAKRLAHCLGFAYLDTGLLYRAVGARILASGTYSEEAAARIAGGLAIADLDLHDLRSDRVAVAASKVAALAPVREALLAFQRHFAAEPPPPAVGAVLDGRDIGSVVCREATVKLFVTASVAVRADRRLRELRDRGLEAIPKRVLQDMKERDARDSSRDTAPLTPADDAFILDTTNLGPDAVFEKALRIVEPRIAAAKHARQRQTR